MTIFKFLGMLPQKKVTQNVKNFHEVSARSRPTYYLGSLKKDGVSCLAVKKKVGEGNYVSQLFTRTGLPMKNTLALAGKLNASTLGEGVYCCELGSHFECSLTELSGCVSPERVNPLEGKQKNIVANLFLSQFDFVTLEEYKAGESQWDFSKRTIFMEAQPKADFLYVLKNQLFTVEQFEAFADRMIDANEEGVVGKIPSEKWIRGHKGKNAVKIVCGVDLDLTCRGVVIGEGKYEGLISGMHFNYKGKECKAGLGKGWDIPKMQEETNKWKENPASVVGRIWRVVGLSIGSKGSIRNPKVRELRFDKTTSDD